MIKKIQITQPEILKMLVMKSAVIISPLKNRKTTVMINRKKAKCHHLPMNKSAKKKALERVKTSIITIIIVLIIIILLVNQKRRGQKAKHQVIRHKIITMPMEITLLNSMKIIERISIQATIKNISLKVKMNKKIAQNALYR